MSDPRNQQSSAGVRIAGRYQLLGELGAGGMATVVRVEDVITGRKVALKQLRSGIPADKRATFEALFAREYHTLARLSHRRIVQVYDYGIANGNAYYTMELLDAQDLRELAPLPYERACRLLRDVASSLALIHAHRLVHRDVSPRNVRLAADGSAKLIDFGALVSFGIAREIIGTPPCVAPEALRHMPLDQRTDLYALGAVAYYALTGRHAFPARTLSDLVALWEDDPPPPPSSFDPTIPPALDTLVMSLLSEDPFVRPAHAAVVIDQLTSIAGLPPEEIEHAAESYLQSGRMTGRDHEVDWIRKELAQAAQSKGRSIVFDGSAGTGKTRLLHELCLEAQLQGAVVVTADAQQSDEPFGVAIALITALSRGWPDLASRFTPRNAGLLARLSPPLREQLTAAEAVELSIDPTERRARFQQALHESCLGVARERVLFVAVDNLHAIDDNSAAFLATLASEAPKERLLLVAMQRSNVEVAARASVEALRKRSSCVRLRNLSVGACTELVKSLFGDAVNTGRTARLVYEHSAGNPQRCMELVRLLVKRGIAKYVDGSWVLPLEIAAGELPSQLEDLAAVRIAGLRPHARALSEAISVYARPIAVEDALSLATAEGENERDAHGALDELLDEEILALEDGRFRFIHGDLREAIFQQMDPEKRRSRHKRAAALIANHAGANVAEQIDAAWHLLLAGESTDGAESVSRTVYSAMKTKTPVGSYSFEQVVEALLAALTVYDEQQRKPHELADVLFPLMSFGFMVDWRIAETYGQRTIELGLDISGLARAKQLQPKLGTKLALGAGLGSAGVSHVARGRSLIATIQNFCAIVPPTIASWTMRYDHRGASRLIALLEPLRMFGPNHVTTLMHDYGVAQLRMVQGRVIEARELLAAIQPRFDDPKVKRLLGDVHLRLLKGGVLFATGIIAPLECENGERQIAVELEALDVQLWAMGAAQVRVLHHALRGEIHEVEQHLERVEVFAVQGGTTWQADMFWPFLVLQCYLETEDRVGARRCVEQLERRAREVPSLQVFADVGRAAYLALRGELTASIAQFERSGDHLASATGVAWSVLRIWYAEALIAAGQAPRAIELLNDTLRILGPDHPYVRREQMQARRLIAVAEASLGLHAEAAHRVDVLLAAHGTLDQPLIVGLLHRTRAEIALAMGDRPTYERHAFEMERRFSGTRNAALVAQCERLMSRTAQAKPDWAPELRAADRAEEQQVLTQLTLAHDRYECALRLILQRARARSAQLYWREHGELRLVASTQGTPASEELEAQLRRLIARAENDHRERTSPAQEQEQLTVMERCARRLKGAPGRVQPPIADGARMSSAPADSAHTEATETLSAMHRVIPLRTRRDMTIYGGVILEMPLMDTDGLDARFFDRISSALAELTGAGDGGPSNNPDR